MQVQELKFNIMILIADSGATKTDWCALDKKGTGKPIFFKSEGYNPNYISGPDIVKSVGTAVPQDFPADEVEEVDFYGAGVTELQYGFMTECLVNVFPNAKVNMAMDLLGSARALLQHEPGFAAILGTGTNSCIYDGKKVTMNIDSLGFILGDEGSGAYLGKRFICDFIRGDMPKEACKIFQEYCPLNGDQLIDEIYTKPFPNRFCARFSKVISANVKEGNYFYKLVYNAFVALFKNIISHYPDYMKYSFNCVGSVGYYYKNILQKAADEYNMKLGNIIQAPMEGLIKFHLER